MSILSRLNIGRDKFVEVATLGDVGLALERSNETTSGFTTSAKRKVLKLEDKEKLYNLEPLMAAAVNKTASKLFSNWLILDDPAEGKSLDDNLSEELANFYNDIELPSKMEQLAKDAMVFGSGYMELIAEKGLQDPSKPLNIGNGIKDVVTIEPTTMMSKIEKLDKEGKSFFYLEKTGSNKIIKHHSSRIIHVTWDKLGTQRFGAGVYDKAYRSMVAKLNMDWALGEIIYRYGKPFMVIKTTGATKKELQKAYKVLRNLTPHSGFAGTERHEFDILNPEAVNPDPFAKYYYINCASALEMPFMVFMGAQKGQLTGSEVDLSDWYNLLESKQYIKFSPVINTINNAYLKGAWKGKVVWQPIYVDDKKEADIKKIYAETAKILFNDAGLITEIEGRQWLRNKGFDIPEDDTMFSDEPSDDDTSDFDFPLEPEEELEWVKNLDRGQLRRLRDKYEKGDLY